MNINNRYLRAILYASIVPIAFWLGGFNFNERGEGACICFVITIYIFLGHLWITK